MKSDQKLPKLKTNKEKKKKVEVERKTDLVAGDDMVKKKVVEVMQIWMILSDKYIWPCNCSSRKPKGENEK